MCADDRASALRWLVVAALMLAGAARAAPPTPTLNSALPIKIAADGFEADLRNNLLTYRKVTISQGEMSIAADAATTSGASAEDTRWDFRGNVRITLPDGHLLGEQAMVQFAKSTISTAQLSGAPATFEQKRDNCVAKGHAGRIDFDFAAETVRLSEQAGIAYGDGEINGRTLIYSIHDQRVLADPRDQGSQQVHITINPQATPAPAGTTKCGR